MAALFIVWTLALWTWVIHEIMENAITVGVDAEGQLQIALSPAMAIVTSILAMLNVALGVAMKHLWDSASHD